MNYNFFSILTNIDLKKKTYNFDIILHVLHLFALGYVFQEGHGNFPHLLVVRILHLSTQYKCNRLSRKPLVINLRHLKKTKFSCCVFSFFSFVVGGSNPLLATQH